jgi:hypothetical protein
MTGGEATLVMVAGVIVGGVVREIPGIIFERMLKLKRNGTGNAGYATHNAIKEIFVDTLKADVMPLLQRQTDILEEMAKSNSGMKDSLLVLTTLQQERKRR